MSHEKPSEDLPDYDKIFRHELGPCKTPADKPKPHDLPPHLRPGNPARWDDHAKYYAELWRLELIKQLEAGYKTKPDDLGNTCREYAKLCFLNGNACEAIALAKMTLRRLSIQPDKRRRAGFKELDNVYQRVYQLAHGCGFYNEAIEFVRYALQLGQEIGCTGAGQYPLKSAFHVAWEAWHLDLADSLLSARRVDEALRALDGGAALCERSNRHDLRTHLDFFAVRIAFHNGKRPEAFKRCLKIIEHYDPKDPRELPLILKAKGLYEEFCP
jgi:tetratricopeptide (TPR) repeat protein